MKMKIALSIVVALFLIGCSDESSKTSDVQSAKTEEVKSVEVGQDTNAVADKTASDKVDEAVHELKESAKDAADEMADKTNEAVANAADGAKDVANSVSDSAAEVATTMTDAMTSMMPGSSSTSGEEIFKVCSSCHGLNAEKSALGKSQIIRGWAASKIENALHGYQDGTYGASMKAVMKGQVSKLDNDDIEAVAEYISKL